MSESFKQISERLLTSSNYEEVDEVEWDIQNLVNIHDKVEKENAELKRKLDLINYYINKSTFQELTRIPFTYEEFSQYTPLEEDGYKWQGLIDRFKEIMESKK